MTGKPLHVAGTIYVDEVCRVALFVRARVLL